MNTNCIGFCVLACIEECLKRSTLWRKLGQNQLILYQLGSHKDVKKSTILNWVKSLLNPFKCQCCPHIETSQLICCANQLTSFYTRPTLALNGLSELLIQFEMVDFLTSLWDVQSIYILCIRHILAGQLLLPRLRFYDCWGFEKRSMARKTDQEKKWQYSKNFCIGNVKVGISCSKQFLLN